MGTRHRGNRRTYTGPWQVLAAAGGWLLVATACSPRLPQELRKAREGRIENPTAGITDPAGGTSVVRARLEVAAWPLDALTVTNSVLFEQRAELDGSVAARNVATGTKLGFGSEVALDNEAVLTGNVRGHRIYTGGQASVTGNAAYNTKTGTGTVQGASTTTLSVPLSITIPSLPSIMPGSQDVTVSASQQQTLAAGAYRDVTLASGNSGGLTRLTLSGGVYHLRKLTVGNDSRVSCSAPCEIRTKERIFVDARSLVGPTNAPGMGPGNVEIFVQGPNGAAGPAGMPSAFQLGNDTDLHAYALVPNGTLRLGHRAEFTGKIVARDVVVGFDNEAEGLQLALITAQPANFETRETDTATFSVAATGEELSYQWQKNGANIPGATGTSYTTPPTVFATDNLARFRVLIANAAGTVTSSEATLTVIPCTVLDLTCDGFNDDCDAAGSVDEDYVPVCSADGTALMVCLAGVHPAVPRLCDDGDACTSVEVCSGDACQPGTPVDTDDGNACTADECDPTTGEVTNTPLADGTECGDGNDCDGLNRCLTGSCALYPNPVSSNVCNPWVCSEDTNQDWQQEPASAGTPCSDGNPRNGGEVCDGSGTCVPFPGDDEQGVTTPNEGSLPGRLRGGYGRAPEHRRVGSKAFKSLGFADPDDGFDDGGEAIDLVAPTGNVFVPSPPEIETRVTLALSDYSDGMAFCPFGDSRIYARVFVDGVAQPDVLIHSYECNLIECAAATPIRWGNFGDFSFEAAKPSVDLAVTFVVKSSCEPDSSFDTGPITIPLDTSQGFTSTPQCGSGSQVNTACWQAVFHPQFPTVPAPALCFDWRTSFVDEFIGEDGTGEPVICSSQCASGACQQPLPGMNVGPNQICTMEQRYPARYAEVQVSVRGRAGSQTLGRHYTAEGEPGAGQPLYLDENGCLPPGTVDPAILAPLSFPSDSQNSVAPLFISARVRSSLRTTGQPETGPGFDVHYADLTRPLNTPDPLSVPFEVVSAGLGGVDLSPLFQAGYALSDDLPAALVDSGVRVLVPPPEIRLESKTIVPGSNAAAVMGSMLKRLKPLRAYNATVRNVFLGRGQEICESFETCSADSDCDGPQRCTNGTCTHCSQGSVYNFDYKVLDIGPAVLEAHAPACTEREQCTEPQSCLKRSGTPCDDGVDCFCAWPEQSSWKYVVAHEAGHQLEDAFVGSLPNNDYKFGEDLDPADTAETCGCAHLGTAFGSHCLQSPELFTAALEEGFGHFVALSTFDDPTTPGAIFAYYKEVLRPDLFPNIPDDVCDAPGACVQSGLGPEWPMALPPVPVDVEIPFKLRNNLCTPLSGQDLSTLSNEHDFLQFFHAIHTDAAPLDFEELYSVLRTTCNGRQADCSTPGQCVPCAEDADPYTCDACEGGVCTNDPCGDVDSPRTCGRKCFSGVDLLPADYVRWAPLLQTEVDGVGNDDVGPTVVSLVDGARRFLDQKYGATSAEFLQFVENGGAHGITQDLAP